MNNTFNKLNSFFNKFRQINRRRNIATTRLKIRLGMFCIDDHFRIKTKLQVNQIKTIIIIMVGKGIGDAIVMTGLIKSLTEASYKVSILCEPPISHIFSRLPGVLNLYLLLKNEEDSLTLPTIRNKKYDLLIDIYDIDHHSLLRLKIIKNTALGILLG